MAKECKKHVIWGNIDIKYEDWVDGYKEEMADRGEDVPEEPDEYEVLEWARELNDHYLDDERANLNQYVGDILVIGDIGTWMGRVTGFNIMRKKKLSDILYSGCDYCEWYSDGKNIRAKMIHHDGTDYLKYRLIKPGVNVDHLEDRLEDGKGMTDNMIQKYTKSLHPYVAKVYGW